jgi:hypothetical protein
MGYEVNKKQTMNAAKLVALLFANCNLPRPDLEGGSGSQVKLFFILFKSIRNILKRIKV